MYIHIRIMSNNPVSNVTQTSTSMHLRAYMTTKEEKEKLRTRGELILLTTNHSV